MNKVNIKITTSASGSSVTLVPKTHPTSFNKGSKSFHKTLKANKPFKTPTQKLTGTFNPELLSQMQNKKKEESMVM